MSGKSTGERAPEAGGHPAPVLRTGDFSLELEWTFWEEDRSLPVNTALRMRVSSGKFCGEGGMDLGLRQLAECARQLLALHRTLKGQVRLGAPYDPRTFLAFSGDGRGHIRISGCLHDLGKSGFLQELSFENEADQTEFGPFVRALAAELAEYGT